jgi:hypothetical protein
VGTLEGATRREEQLAPILADRPVRSVYLPILRDRLPDALEVFDAAEPAFVTGDREETNVATQALYLMNDKDVLAAADAFAERLLAFQGDEDERIGRPSSAPGASRTGPRTAAVRRFPARLAQEDARRCSGAWSTFAQTLFSAPNSATRAEGTP